MRRGAELAPTSVAFFGSRRGATKTRDLLNRKL